MPGAGRSPSELGANEVIDGGGSVDAVRELTGGHGADLVFDFVGTDQSHADSLAMLARGGTYSIIGFGGMVSAPSAVMVGGEQTVKGNLVGTWLDLWEVMQLHGTGRLVLKTESHRLDDVNDVLAKLREGEVTGRAVLRVAVERQAGRRRRGVERRVERGIERGRGRLAAQEIGRAQQLGLLGQLLGRALVADAAALEHVGAVREAERDVRELLDQQHADARRGDRPGAPARGA